MSEPRPIHPLLKLGLEFGPLLLFFVTYQRSDIYTATAIFIPVILVALGASWFLSRELPRMAVVTAIVVVVFGGLTLWLQDATFIKMKPTIINTLFAGALLFGLARRRSYMKDLIGSAMPLSDEGWTILTKRWVLFFIGMAVLNEIVWRSQTESFWVSFKTFASPAITFAFVLSQFPVIKKYGIEDEKG